MVVVRGRAPRNQSLRGPTPCARGPLCLPRPAFSPILSGCGGLPPLKASDQGLLVKIIQGKAQMLMFCLRVLDFPILWLVALWQPAGEVWRSCAHLVAHCLLHVVALVSDLGGGTKSARGFTQGKRKMKKLTAP